MATEEEIPASWENCYHIFDFIFLVDIILTFFTSYHDEKHDLEILEHKLIAKKYLKSWFLLDLISIFPFDLVGHF